MGTKQAATATRAAPMGAAVRKEGGHARAFLRAQHEGCPPKILCTQTELREPEAMNVPSGYVQRQRQPRSLVPTQFAGVQGVSEMEEIVVFVLELQVACLAAVQVPAPVEEAPGDVTNESTTGNLGMHWLHRRDHNRRFTMVTNNRPAIDGTLNQITKHAKFTAMFARRSSAGSTSSGAQ